MKFLKLKYIVSYVIILVVVTLVLLYFVGGLKVGSLTDTSLPFDETGFIDFSTGQKDIDGNSITLTYDHEKVIAETDTHVLLFDEETTIGKVVDKRTCPAGGTWDDCTVSYRTAKDDLESAAGANLLVYYAARSNGIAYTTPYDTMTSSVKFKNTLTNELESHYKLKYIDGGVQILYDIGRFSANNDYFPVNFNIAKYNEKYTSSVELTEDQLLEIERYNLQTIDERFRGNITFGTKIEKTDDPDVQLLSFTGVGTIFSYEAKEYIVQNNLAVVTTDDEKGFKDGWWRMEEIDESFYNSYGTHLNSDTSPCTNNPFFSTQMYQSMSETFYTRTRDNDSSPYYYKLLMTSSSLKSKCYDYLYTSFQQLDTLEQKHPLYWKDTMEPVIRGGFHARDAEGNFLYDEEGNPVQRLYDLELVAEDNALFGVETSTSLQRFQVCLQLLLSDEGLEATVLTNSLRDSDHKALNSIYDHNYIMTGVQFLKEMTTSYDVAGDGMMIIPDGSGAIINFNNGKAVLNYAGYNKKVYGNDRAFVLNQAPEDVEDLMFGMYGFIDTTAGKGLMTIVEEGAALSKLSADIPRGTSQYNTIYYTTSIRENEFVTAGTGWNAVKFPKWSRILAPNDVVYNFMFLEADELSYVGVANRYRDYLIEKYDLEVKDTTTTNLTNLNLLGAFEHYDMFLGIKYMRPDNLTSFSQAKSIVSELFDEGVTNLSVSYSSWTDDEFEYETTAHLRASEALGRKKGLTNLASYLEEQGIPFYPELFVATSKGYDYPFGNIKYTTKSVGNSYATQYPFNLATLFQDKTLTPTYYITPSFYPSITRNLLNSYKQFGIEGAYFPDLGNMKIGDYSKNSEIFSPDGNRYQQQSLAIAQEYLDRIQLSAPYDYIFPYVDTAINVPVGSSTYGIFDQTIPFYQLVVSGLFDYTTELVNGTSDKSYNYYFVKALETGSNLYFQLSYEDPKVLLETDYTQYYKTYYQNWKDIIVEFNQKINDSQIHQGRLINHERVAKDVAKVTYSNGVVLVINSSNKAYQYGARAIAPYNYISIGG